MKTLRHELNAPPSGGIPHSWGQEPETLTFEQQSDTELELLKNRLLQQALGGSVTTSLAKPLRRAANEAAAIAWLEPLPLLVFPTLFEEKARLARRQAQRQELVQARSSEWLQEVA
jgi:hypothetical protein